MPNVHPYRSKTHAIFIWTILYFCFIFFVFDAFIHVYLVLACLLVCLLACISKCCIICLLVCAFCPLRWYFCRRLMEFGEWMSRSFASTWISKCMYVFSLPSFDRFFRKQLMCFVYLIDSILRMVRLRSSHFTFGFRTIRHSFVVFSKYFFHCHRSPSDICAIDKVITKIPIHASYRTEIVEREKEMMLWGNTALWTLLNKNNSKWITKEW